jgi:kynurenine formamidase
MTSERDTPSRGEVLGFLQRHNWGRWGADDQRGAINLITAEKRVAAARLVRSGRAVSLSREFPTTPGPLNPRPAQHFMQWSDHAEGGLATDYYGVSYHGYATTHVDALCHMWGPDGMWGGHDAKQALTTQGARWGAIEQWHEGIVTRGVLLDVPRFRGEPCVTLASPVHGWELEEIARREGLELEPGDAIAVYCGRENFRQPDTALSAQTTPQAPIRPGLHASCLKFLRDHDVAVLIWDMLDAVPNDYGLRYTVHCAIWAYGVALVDNALLQPLSVACAEEQRYTFMLSIAPLRVVGGTGSPVNPIALF